MWRRGRGHIRARTPAGAGLDGDHDRARERTRALEQVPGPRAAPRLHHQDHDRAAHARARQGPRRVGDGPADPAAAESRRRPRAGRQDHRPRGAVRTAAGERQRRRPHARRPRGPERAPLRRAHERARQATGHDTHPLRQLARHGTARVPLDCSRPCDAGPLRHAQGHIPAHRLDPGPHRPLPAGRSGPGAQPQPSAAGVRLGRRRQDRVQRRVGQGTGRLRQARLRRADRGHHAPAHAPGGGRGRGQAVPLGDGRVLRRSAVPASPSGSPSP